MKRFPKTPLKLLPAIGLAGTLLSHSTWALPLFPKLTNMPIATTTNREVARGLASDGTNFLVVLQGDGLYAGDNQTDQLAAQLLSPDGLPIGGRIDLHLNGSIPLLAFDGTNFLMAWAGHPPSSLGVYGQFLSRSGTKLGDEFLIHPNAAVAEVGGLCFGTGHYLAVWSTSTAPSNAALIQGRLLTTAGALVGEVLSLGTAGSGDQEYPSAGPGSTNFLVTWVAQRDDTNVWDVLGRFVDAAGQASAEFVISQSPATVLSGDFEAVSGFGESSNPLTQYLWSRFSEAGRELILACEASHSRRGLIQSALAKELNGCIYGGSIYETQRFAEVTLSQATREWTAQNPQGEDLIRLNRRLLEEAFFITWRCFAPSPALAAHPVGSAFDGTNHLVVWSRGGPAWPFRLPGYDSWGDRNSTNLAFPMIVGRLVSGNGEPLDYEFEISRARCGQVLPSVLFDGTNYLVSWIDQRMSVFDWYWASLSTDPITNQMVFLQFVSPQGLRVESEFPIWDEWASTNSIQAARERPALALGNGRALLLRNETRRRDRQSENVTAVVIQDRPVPPPPQIQILGLGANHNLRLRLLGDPSVDYCLVPTTNLARWPWAHDNIWSPDEEPYEPICGWSQLDYEIPVDVPARFFRAVDGRLECQSNLRKVMRAKELWALLSGKINGDWPMDYDLFGATLYLQRMPACVNGGIYSWNPVGERPSCSVPSHGSL